MSVVGWIAIIGLVTFAIASGAVTKVIKWIWDKLKPKNES